MAADDSGAWRDEERLALGDLVEAVATSADDGQRDDLAGNDAGIQQRRPDAEDRAGDPDPTSSEGRALQTGFTGRTGPN